MAMARNPGGGGQWINVAKIAVFGVLILGGFWVVGGTSLTQTGAAMTPFFVNGAPGLFRAMGFTFIALQGFDLIAAVGGEVREPARTLPRAMILSLLIALAVYLPLLFVIAAVGVPGGASITNAAAEDPEGIVACAALHFLGPFGYWLVIVAAVLSMFSALQANVFAASKIAQTMARDRTLPARMRAVSSRRGTPVMAIAATVLLAIGTLVALPDVGTAGAASSLIFLLTFALAHGISILVRIRSKNTPPPFRTGFFPLVPVVGGLACIGLAVFQGFAVPAAGLIALVWLGLGGLLFINLFARHAHFSDAFRTAVNPELVTLRGQTPLVLVPIANPDNVDAMITIADAMVPARVGRVLALQIVVAEDRWNPAIDPLPLSRARQVFEALIGFSAGSGIKVDSLGSMAEDPMREIARVARLHRCETVLLGLSDITSEPGNRRLESLIGNLDANVMILRAPGKWRLDRVHKILIPVAGRGGHEHLILRLLGSLLRETNRQAVFLQVLPSRATGGERRKAIRVLRLLAEHIGEQAGYEVVMNDDPLSEICQRADQSDLLVLGVHRVGRDEKLLGAFTRKIAMQTQCPILIASRRG
jgi:nucleotide-binding universal stress UspA family protein